MALAFALRPARIDVLEPFIDEGANTLSSLDETVSRAFNPAAQGRPSLSWMFRPAEFLSFSTTTNARVVVAFTGATTVALLGLGLCAGSRAALIGMLLWATLPIVVFYERLVLQYPAVAALVSSVFVLIALFAHTAQPRRRSALVCGAGFLVGTAVLVKRSAVLALTWLGLALFAMQRQSGRPVFERSDWLVAVGAMLPFLFLGADLMRLGARLTELGSVPDYKSTTNKLAIIGAMAAETRALVTLFFFRGMRATEASRSPLC